MRGELQQWVATYPKVPGRRDGTFTGAPAAQHVREVVPSAIAAALGDRAERYLIRGSAGQGDWTHTPWVALLDPAAATSVEEGIYVVYLLSLGCERLYLTLNQGCTSLFNAAGKTSAREELERRGRVMRDRVATQASRLASTSMDLAAGGWRSELYEAGQVLGREYDATALPSEEELRADLSEALGLYRAIVSRGGWIPDDLLIEAAQDTLGSDSIEHAVTYAQHRRIERNSGHSKKVKQAQGTVCRACGIDPANVYGELGSGMVEAHHLFPLAKFREGEVARFDVMTDFAVLCPSCHRAIHRMKDVSDLEGLRTLIQTHGVQK